MRYDSEDEWAQRLHEEGMGDDEDAQQWGWDRCGILMPRRAPTRTPSRVQTCSLKGRAIDKAQPPKRWTRVSRCHPSRSSTTLMMGWVQFRRHMVGVARRGGRAGGRGRVRTAHLGADGAQAARRGGRLGAQRRCAAAVARRRRGRRAQKGAITLQCQSPCQMKAVWLDRTTLLVCTDKASSLSGHFRKRMCSIPHCWQHRCIGVPSISQVGDILNEQVI
jgi:hypothetical protein